MDKNHQPGKEYTQAERNGVVFAQDHLYMHKYLRVNFTTYDGRRSQDSINPRTQPDIMALAETGDDKNEHFYCYARVLGIFHANIFSRQADFGNGKFEQVNFLWVRWFSYDTESPAGFEHRRLHRLCFYHYHDSDEFDFLNPNYVL
jgi:hypothetical protein